MMDGNEAVAAQKRRLRWAYNAVNGRAGPLSYNEAQEATALVHRDAQWREVPLREAIAVAALIEDFIEGLARRG